MFCSFYNWVANVSFLITIYKVHQQFLVPKNKQVFSWKPLLLVLKSFPTLKGILWFSERRLASSPPERASCGNSFMEKEYRTVHMSAEKWLKKRYFISSFGHRVSSFKRTGRLFHFKPSKVWRLLEGEA